MSDDTVTIRDGKTVIVLGSHFYDESSRMRRAETERFLAAVFGAPKPSMWRRIVRWLKGGK